MTMLHGPASLDVCAQVDPILRRAIYWGPAPSGAADSRISRIAAGTLSISIGAGFTETVRFYGSGIDIGFNGYAMGQTIGSPDTYLHRGLSGGVEVDSSGGLGAYGFLMAAQFGSFQKYADSAPQAVLYKAQDAYDISTGANRTGADVRLAAGIGQWVVTVVDWTMLAGATLTYIENGTTVVLTEGVDWTAATSNAATATSLRAAMVASGSMVADANSLGAGIIGASGVESTWSLSITSSDLVNLTVSQPTGNGTVRVGLKNDGTTILAISPSSIAAGLDILPTTSGARNLGSASLLWATLFARFGLFDATASTGFAIGYYNNSLRIGSGSTIAWMSSTPDAGTEDAILARDAAATIAQKNGANAQAFRVYGNTTGAKYVSLAHDGTDGSIATTAGDLYLNPTGNVKFGTFTADLTVLLAGYITIKDAGGATRKLAVFA